MVGETNKVVIVTGGSSGIGRCTASALKENGCVVYEFSRRSIPNEVKPYGIHVTVVELGDICTGFTKARQKSILGDDEYGGRISRSVSQMEHDEQNGMDPARIGRYIAGIVEKKNPAVVYVAGAQYKFLSLLCKLLPAAARGKIVGKIYG